MEIVHFGDPNIQPYCVSCILCWPWPFESLFFLFYLFLCGSLAIVVDFARFFERHVCHCRSPPAHSHRQRTFFFWGQFRRALAKHSCYNCCSGFWRYALTHARTQQTASEQPMAQVLSTLFQFVFFNRLMVFIVVLRVQSVSIGILYISAAEYVRHHTKPQRSTTQSTHRVLGQFDYFHCLSHIPKATVKSFTIRVNFVEMEFFALR